MIPLVTLDKGRYVLDKLLSLYIGHAVHTSDTITRDRLSAQILSSLELFGNLLMVGVVEGPPYTMSPVVLPRVVFFSGAPHTRRKERGQSQQGWTPPGHHGCAARE